MLMDAAVEKNMMRQALVLARRGYGRTSPNPMVGAVLVQHGKIIARGWHRAAGKPHAEIEALQAARRAGRDPKGATLYVTLEPCSTHGRTPPCTEAIIAAGIRRMVAAAEDPNPAHAGAGFDILRKAGIEVVTGVCGEESARLNEAFNHWIVHRTPLVTLKAAMSLDGKIATRGGDSKWISGERSRRDAMKMRAGMDAILVGVNTIVADDPQLTIREPGFADKAWRRIVLDPTARIPLQARALNDESAGKSTIVVVTRRAPKARVEQIRRRAAVWIAPMGGEGINLAWVLASLGRENVTHLLVEGGGETHARFLRQRAAHRVVFYYAPMVMGGVGASTAVGGPATAGPGDGWNLREAKWRRLGGDLRLTARIDYDV
jgi:diaminohydroxyphosphoribosylaminopyrimidine deaminase/5-amino-6-(5-phosphoribosylamino)uracil reductase